jgi:hypothetical protein
MHKNALSFDIFPNIIFALSDLELASSGIYLVLLIADTVILEP